MHSAADQMREQFQTAMAEIAVGATLVRRTRHWTVVKQRRYDTSIELTLRHGRHEIKANVPVCNSGPILWEVGLRPAASAPSQRNLFREAA